MKTIQEMLQELSQCIVTVSGEFRFRTNWNGGKVPQPDLDTFDPNVPFCIENVGDVPVEVGLYDVNYKDPNFPFLRNLRKNCKISYNLKSWQDYVIARTENASIIPEVNKIILKNKGDRVYIKAEFLRSDDQRSAHFIVLNQSSDTKIRARGNIISLNKGDNDEYKTKYLELTLQEKHCFDGFFKNCSSLVQAPELPSTTVYNSCYENMFAYCTGLTQAPELPATNIGDSEDAYNVYGGCYENMFAYCTGLTQAPELPAMHLSESCYKGMFLGCTGLIQAPALPATTLAFNCYESMFAGCRSLTKAPELPATITRLQCYDSMFDACSSLTQAPELPATKFYGETTCYHAMFRNCTSLTRPPAKLPAMSLESNCYDSMFQGCTSLTQAPELPATTLAPYCYISMFSGCTKLNYVKCLATDTSATDCTASWLEGVSATGTFECDNKKYFTLDSPNGIPAGWSITEINPEPEKPDLDTFDPNVPFCIENVGDVQASIQYNTKNTSIRISKDYKTWNDYTTGDSITLDPTDRVYIKSDYVKDTGSSPRFVFNGDGARLRARGNIASLIYGTNDAYVNKYTSTEEHCYKYMFWNCTSLTQAPELPATTLADYCYHQMFDGCTSLTQAPELPATILHDLCYFLMFRNCASLTQAPDLLAIKLAQGCCQSMFEGCTSLTQAPKLPATTLAYMCYARMFQDCTSLTRAPELPSTNLADLCYASMFKGCTKLNYVKCLAKNISAKNCTANWLEGVATTGDFYTPASTRWTTGTDGIPSGWTRHDIT